jgi:hypothetical protein
VQGASAPTANINFDFSINGGAFANEANLSSNGTMSAVGYNLANTLSSAYTGMSVVGASTLGLRSYGTTVWQSTSTLQTDQVPHVTGSTAFTVSGCGTAGTITGNGGAGTFTVGTGAGTCTFTITVNGATGMTAPHGWITNMDDVTAKIHCVNATGGSTTTAVALCNSTVTTSDLIAFSLTAY